MSVRRLSGKLIELIDRLDELDDSDAFAPLIIYTKNGSRGLPNEAAMVCPDDETASRACPEDPTLSHFLMVQLAREAIEVWSAWRGGRTPTKEEKLAAVKFYSCHDAYLPVEDENAQP
jgi:hypothetical protein